MPDTIPMHLYDLADSAGFPLTVTKNKIRGDHRRQIDFTGLKVQFGVSVVSSVCNERASVILMKGPGDLGICLMAGGSAQRGRLLLLDLSRLPVPAEDLLEKKKISAQAAIEAFLTPAIVVTFEKANNKKWQEAQVVVDLDSSRKGAD